MFEKTFVAGWGDMDYNAHMRNTAYLDKAADLRMMFFAEHGLPMSEFMRLRIGPVVMRDEIEYFREVKLLQSLRVGLMLAGVSPDGSRFRLRNLFWVDETLVARLTSTGGWLDLEARKLVAPPDLIMAAQADLARSEDFAELPSSLKG
ncbi:acyl-CoA thioesterase [Uliginosibacterium sp. H1]|uniref:acyl-CoA thioesterase n=1 Tax=Uliginosibacterium sp. H1 TaxID=3114757 RepID=UPI002E1811B8|nr:thioesterase family protein [Uliginosibacterium sp. H1]